MITTDLHARLSAALGPDIPVLLPEQQRDPLTAAPVDAQGRPAIGSGERGLGAYLAQHTAGYVQIEQPTPLTSDGTLATFWVAVASIAPSRSAAQSLAASVRLALNGTSTDPGPHAEVLPAQPALLSGSAWMVRTTYDALTLDGQPVH